MFWDIDTIQPSGSIGVSEAEDNHSTLTVLTLGGDIDVELCSFVLECPLSVVTSLGVWVDVAIFVFFLDTDLRIVRQNLIWD